LEYIKGFIYANVWMNNFIFKINPSTGAIVGKLDLSLLSQDARNKNPGADVLNGIAYDSISDKIYVTGKMWPNIYQINFNH
jgi:glutamine cyclotransferase